MRYFRLVEKRAGRSPIGYGTPPGRWNFRGTPIIYACNQISINFVELMSIKGSAVMLSEWQLVTLSIQVDIPHVLQESLPADWADRPYPFSTQKFGSAWAEKHISPFLKVPSARLPLIAYPAEHNLLINPLHEEAFKNIQVVDVSPVSFALNV